MIQKQLIAEIRRRAASTDESDGNYAYSVGADDEGDGGSLGLLQEDGLQSTTPKSAVFCMTDGGVVDRDGDVVNVEGIRTEDWKAAGAPVFAFHQGWPMPIGSCLNPNGKLDVWIKGDKMFGRVWWDLDDPNARAIARKVAKGLMRSCSIAFVPIEAYRREDVEKAQTHAGIGVPSGWYFNVVSITELSIVGIGSNQNALLQNLPEPLRKALAVCVNGKCFTKEASRVDWAEVRRRAARLQPLNMPDVVVAKSLEDHHAAVLEDTIRHCHEGRMALAKAMRAGMLLDAPEQLTDCLMQYSATLRKSAESLVSMYDTLGGTDPETAKEWLPVDGEESDDPELEPDTAEILERYGDEDEEPEDLDSLLALYRFPGVHAAPEPPQ